MRVAVFHPLSLFCAWSCSFGIVDELKRMGHDAFGYGICPSTEVPLKRSSYPTLEELKTFDRIILSGPEHIACHTQHTDFLFALYPEWKKVRSRTVTWLHETVNREDYGQLRIDEIKKLGVEHYTPAAQDEKYGLKWLPFGVDTTMFSPGYCGYCLGTGKDFDDEKDCEQCKGTAISEREPLKSYGPTFVGYLYPKRQEFLAKAGIELHSGNVQVMDLNGLNHRMTASLYASELRKISVLVNLPAMCDHLVTKVFEAMATGTAVVTNIGKERKNYELFENGKHLLYYENNPKEPIESLKDEAFRGRLAMQGCKEVHEKHSLRKRLEVILQ